MQDIYTDFVKSLANVRSMNDRDFYLEYARSMIVPKQGCTITNNLPSGTITEGESTGAESAPAAKSDDDGAGDGESEPACCRPQKPKRKAPDLSIIQTMPDDALISIQVFAQLTGQGLSTVWRKIGAGTKGYPKPVYLGTRCTRLKLGDVRKLLREGAV